MRRTILQRYVMAPKLFYKILQIGKHRKSFSDRLKNAWYYAKLLLKDKI